MFGLFRRNNRLDAELVFADDVKRIDAHEIKDLFAKVFDGCCALSATEYTDSGDKVSKLYVLHIKDSDYDIAKGCRWFKKAKVLRLL